jgi:hypothetical protein
MYQMITTILETFIRTLNCTLTFTLNSLYRFGEILNINVDLTKKSAVIKFKEIESASKAAKSDDLIFGNPRIRVHYTIPPVIEEGKE